MADEAGFARGTAHLEFRLWGLRLAVVRTRLWLGPGWNGWWVVGGCLLVRAGPFVLTWWRGR